MSLHTSLNTVRGLSRHLLRAGGVSSHASSSKTSRTLPSLTRQVHTSQSLHALRPQQQQQQQQQSKPTKPSKPIGTENEKIPFRTVQLVSNTDGTLGSPTALNQILRSLDKASQTLRLVSAEPPIVKVIDRAAEKDKQRLTEAKQKISRLVAVENKEFQISWGSAIGDLRHKAVTARGVLEKGDRATLIFASKAGGGGGGGAAGATGIGEKGKTEQRKAAVAVFEEALEEVGSKWREDEVRKGAYVQYWGPAKAVRDEKRTKLQEERVERRKEKDDAKEARRKKDQERERKAAEKRAAALAAASAAAGDG